MRRRIAFIALGAATLMALHVAPVLAILPPRALRTEERSPATRGAGDESLRQRRDGPRPGPRAPRNDGPLTPPTGLRIS